MKIRNGFVSNSSSTSYTIMTFLNDKSCYCPECYSNREIHYNDDEDYYECQDCDGIFYDPLKIKDIRKIKLDKLDVVC